MPEFATRAIADDLPALFLLSALALSAYTVGANVIESQVNYRTWRFLAASPSFRDYHRALGPRVVALLVGPFGVGLALMFALLCWRPPLVPLPALWLAIILDAIPILTTLGWQLPAQRRLDRDGWSGTVVAGLIRREWFRLIPHVLKVLLLMWLVARIVLTKEVQ